MKDISILIPTCRRAHFLQAALQSVARQTALARIGEVLVMENGEDRRSEAVCQQFPNLPIKYIYRDPTIPLSKWTVATLSEASLPLVAMLHDDDWWLDFHLERSLGKLDDQPNLSAVYSSFFFTESENLWFRGVNGNFTAWFGNDQSINGEARVLNFKQMIITSLLQSGFHMSSLVFRRSVIKACFPAFDDGNEFDVDRTLAVELSRQGDVLFHDTPSLVVRLHPGQDGVQAIKDNRAAPWFQKNTRRLIKQAQDASIDIRSELSSRISRPGFDSNMAMRFIGPEALNWLAADSLLSPPWLRAYRHAKLRARFFKVVSCINRWMQAVESLGRRNTG